MIMIVSLSPDRTSSFWLSRWALVTVGLTCLALLSGAIVTTFRVGMADRIWPTYPWHLLLISWEEPRAGFLIEHAHRAFDYLLGLAVIILALGLWKLEDRRWVRWLGVAAVGGVIVQGLVGGFRVVLNELLGRDLALVHGCFAQLVFGLLVSLALFSSPGWRAAKVIPLPDRKSTRLNSSHIQKSRMPSSA